MLYCLKITLLPRKKNDKRSCYVKSPFHHQGLDVRVVDNSRYSHAGFHFIFVLRFINIFVFIIFPRQFFVAIEG